MIDLLDLGCYFSINSNMAAGRSNSKYLRIPADRILVESDGPYTKVSEQKYIPEYLQQSYQLISGLYGIPDLASIVYSNFRAILER